MNDYPSKILEDAVNELSKLPGIGKKTALRLALHIIQDQTDHARSLGNSIHKLKTDIMFCKHCHNISDQEVCNICADHKRDPNLVCVVEDVRDVLAIENTAQYHGYYHILGGKISPMEGISPSDLTINQLIRRVKEGSIGEVILALSTTIEGDTTAFYIYKQLQDTDTQITTIARGIAVGDELELADEITLGRSILNRLPFNTGN